MISSPTLHEDLQRRALLLIRGRRDRELTTRILEHAGFVVHACRDVNELCECITEGAGAALIAEELLVPSSVEILQGKLATQPPWSDFPLIIFSYDAVRRARKKMALGNATFLDRPVHVRSMIASVRVALRARERQYLARTAIEARDKFLAMLGHELRNPLGAIRLAISLMEVKTPAIATTKEHGILERQTRHLTRLVDDLLDVARITHGKVVLKREPLDLIAVVRAAFETMESRAREHGLSYDLVLPKEAVWVNADRQRLDQVLSNLLTNAFKYTPPGGGVHVALTATPASARLTISDSGIGIEASMLERVFEVFAQVDSSSDRAAGGMGLGLALVKSVVELHGGSVRAASAGRDHGSAFTVELPRIESAESEAPPPSIAPGSGATRKRVVVVEDAADIRNLLRDLLEHLGHEVHSASDGIKGLATILHERPDVAFVDIGLPGLDGLALARSAREAGYRGVLIAMTGYGQYEDKKRALDAGFAEHLTKPAALTDIERVIARSRR